jgi:hypothetical protein
MWRSSTLQFINSDILNHHIIVPSFFSEKIYFEEQTLVFFLTEPGFKIRPLNTRYLIWLKEITRIKINLIGILS